MELQRERSGDTSQIKCARYVVLEEALRKIVDNCNEEGGTCPFCFEDVPDHPDTCLIVGAMAALESKQ